MPHLLDPPQLLSKSAYYAALDELDALMATDPDAPVDHRFDELIALIDEYEARCRSAGSMAP